MQPPPPPMPGPMTNPHGVHYMEANGGDRFAKHVPQWFILIMNVINAITQLLLGGVVIAALIMANMTNFTIVIDWPGLPSWTITSYITEHIYLCVIGYMVLMSQAILTFNPHAGWANNLLHPQKRVIHCIMQVLGSALAITGSVLKIFDDFDHLQSAHGIIGLVAMMFTVISLIGGVLNLVFPTQTKTKIYSTCHGCLGSFTITLAFISICFAFHDYFRSTFGDTNANIVIVMTVGALSGILAASCTRIYKRLVE